MEMSFLFRIANQVNWNVTPPHGYTPNIKILDIIKISLPKFNGSKVDENPMEFIDEAYQIVALMGISP